MTVKTKVLFPDIMVDIETTGTDSAVNAILQIAARPFNAETMEVSKDAFEVCLHVPKGRTWQKSNIAWWADNEDKAKTLQYIGENREDWWGGMEKLKVFIMTHCPEIGVRFWSNHSMDWEFIQSYMYQYEWQNPCHFCNVKELNSVVSGITGLYDRKKLNATRPLLNEAKAHDGRFDCDWQIEWYKRVKNGELEPTEVEFEGYGGY